MALRRFKLRRTSHLISSKWIQLPEVSGWDCIRSMRKIEAIDAIPICVVTASGFYGKGNISDIRSKVQAEMEKAVSIPAYVAMVHTLLYGPGASPSPTLIPRLAKPTVPYLDKPLPKVARSPSPD